MAPWAEGAQQARELQLESTEKTSKVTETRSREVLGHEEEGGQTEETSLTVAGRDLLWL